MKLYSGTTKEFTSDVRENKLADKLKAAYESYYYKLPNPAEVTSWTNSLQFVKNAIELSSLGDNMVVVEYELPYANNRVDCMLFGEGVGGGNVVLLELKQWTKVQDCDLENNVITFVGGANRMEAHPSYQVGGYHWYLKDFVEAFEGPQALNLSSASYCHNYSRTADVLFGPKFEQIMKEFPVFSKEDAGKLAEYLRTRLGEGKGLEILNRFTSSRIRPSKHLLEHAKKMVDGQRVFNLIEDQIAAYNTILDRAKKSAKLRQKSVIIVRGGPGTGKSAIALNVISELLSRKIPVFHATGSAAFTTTLRKIVGTRAASLFKYFNSFTAFEANQIDVLVCDEAHRIRKTSVSRYTKKEFRSDRPQVEELINAAKVSIFFIDDYQLVRPEEIGSSDLIRNTARKFTDEVFEFELKTQFRCNGSDGYLNWLDDALGVRNTANLMLTSKERMDFKIFDDPKSLYEEIMRKNAEKPNSARMVAGFCWPWSNPNPDGTLKEDVIIGDFKMTWEAKNDAARLAPGIPRAALWAYDPNGVKQMGSIYTIQGFEFDYVGVVFGDDFVYNPTTKTWIGKPENSADHLVKRDSGRFLQNVRNVYRVLMTRGMKGCYVYFMNKDTELFFKSRIQALEN